MSAPRGLSQMDREMRSGTWSAFEGEELRGKTLGIVGTGAVGAELCRIAAGFGMNCIAWNRSSVVSSLSCKEVPLKQVFRDADAVSLHIAFSDTTNKIIGAPFLQSMKPGAILVNTARGGVVIGIAEEFNIPVRFIGVGEKIEDLRPFEAGEFVAALFGDGADDSEAA